MKKIFLFFIVAILLCFPCKAEEFDGYSEGITMIDGENIENYLDEETKSFFDKNGIDIKDTDWTNSLSAKNVFYHIWQLFKTNFKEPFKSGGIILSIIIIYAGIQSFAKESQIYSISIYACVLSIIGIIGSDFFSVVKNCENILKGSCTFMMSFVPVFAASIAIGGKISSSIAMSGLLLGAAETVSFLIGFIVLPLNSAYLSINISTSVSPLVRSNNLSNIFKKTAIWIFSFVSSVFIAILSVQTSITSAKDGVSMKMTRFILGTTIPIAGSALSETITTVSAAFDLLKTSVGIYGIVALSIMFLPIIAEIICYKFVLFVCEWVSSIFDNAKITGLLKSLNSTLSLLLATVLFIGGLFIISLCITVSMVKI